MSTDLQTGADLRDALDATHDRALDALADRPFDSIAACSAHLAAVELVLYRTAARRVPDVRDRLRAARRVDRALQEALCRLDRHLTGDVHLAGVPVETSTARVRTALEAHVVAEQRVVRALDAVLAPEERAQLAGRLAQATTLGPTRPHPHTRPSPLVVVLDALVDRARDLMDNRHPATGRPVRAVRPPGRWGAYLMGLPFPQQRRASAPDEGGR